MTRKTLLFLVVLVIVITSVAQAGLITSIERRNSTNAALQIAGPLAEGSLCFVDRTAATHGPGGHQYKEIPAYLLGADYVMTANADRTVATFELDVTLAQSAYLFLLIDNRVGDPAPADKTTPPTLGNGVMNWVAEKGFVSTGNRVSIDESGNGSIDNYFTVYMKKADAGKITLLQQNAGSLNMYGVVAGNVIPEPATLILLGFGGLALLRNRKNA